MADVLVVADFVGPHDALVAAAKKRAAASDALHLLVPAAPLPHTHTDGQREAAARERLTGLLDALNQSGVHADGEVGDPNVFQAVADALRRTNADDLIVVTPPKTGERRDHLDIADHLERAFERPVQRIEQPGARLLAGHRAEVGFASEHPGPPAGAGIALRNTMIGVAAVIALCGAVVLGYVLHHHANREAALRGAQRIAVTEHDFRIQVANPSPRAGKIAFLVANGGPSAHEFVLFKTARPAAGMPLGSDGNIDEGSPLLNDVLDSGSDITPGKERDLIATLPAGHYVAVCNLPGHYRLGMRVDINVSG
ncbi:MAG: hypothetical protein JWL83_3628 [Actinomycetia bacterium]|nr:hypothetical protein [Actinomycetes bacterium]